MRKFDNSDRLYARALKTIPTGAQTFSKSAQMMVRGASPLFLERANGARVWDVDGNEYLDFILGLLPVVLGHCDPDVDSAIRAQMEYGTCFSLATELESELAERLVRLIPCAESVRFGKNGTDATSASVRLARAFTGRERVAVCGYHGWQDWYIGTTSRHLGVPKSVRALTTTFPYNDSAALARLIDANQNEYAAVILEPASLEEPAQDFLQEVRALTEKNGIVLIFDEIVTGLRLSLGGAQEAYGVTPDLACFGKALGNGMPISAVVGRADIMGWMEKIFFSGTFNGEPLSLAAAIATIDKMERLGGVARIHATGHRLANGVRNILAEKGLNPWISVVGSDWWPAVTVRGTAEADANLVTSLLRQELAEAGILFLSTFNLCLAHDDETVIKQALRAWTQAAEACNDALVSEHPEARLRGEPIRPVFEVRAKRDSGI